MLDLDSLIIRRESRPDVEPAPRHGADEAAALLRAEGKHVHLVSDGNADCSGGGCIPAPVRGLLVEPPTAPRPRTGPLPHIRPLI